MYEPWATFTKRGMHIILEWLDVFQKGDLDKFVKVVQVKSWPLSHNHEYLTLSWSRSYDVQFGQECKMHVNTNCDILLYF